MAQTISSNNLQSLILQCGSIHECRRFCTNALDQLATVVPFDQGRIYFLNEDMAIYDEHLLGVDPRITREYREHYSKLEEGRYSIPHRYRVNKGVLHCIDWSQLSQSDSFVREHLRPQNIRYSTGIYLPDLYGVPRVLFCLDRTSGANYSRDELNTLDLLQKHLSNLYQNFFAESPTTQCAFTHATSEKSLTPRECDILMLLMQGLSSQQIADKIFISKATVIKHISHIYQKLHVNSRAELFAHVLTEYRQSQKRN